MLAVYVTVFSPPLTLSLFLVFCYQIFILDFHSVHLDALFTVSETDLCLKKIPAQDTCHIFSPLSCFYKCMSCLTYYMISYCTFVTFNSPVYVLYLQVASSHFTLYSSSAAYSECLRHELLLSFHYIQKDM